MILFLDIDMVKQEVTEGLNDAEYVCNICGKRYENASWLIYHQKKDCSAVSKFQCNICEKSFKRKHHAEYHAAYVHKGLYLGYSFKKPM